MATTTRKKVAAKASRYDELKKMLEDRRRDAHHRRTGLGLGKRPRTGREDGLGNPLDGVTPTTGRRASYEKRVARQAVPSSP